MLWRCSPRGVESYWKILVQERTTATILCRFLLVTIGANCMPGQLRRLLLHRPANSPIWTLLRYLPTSARRHTSFSLLVYFMPSRRDMLEFCGRSIAAILSLPFLACIGQDSLAQVPRGPVLEERLLTGLRVKTAADRKFIERVVLLVQQNRLPIKLVDSTYFWARSRATRNRGLINNPMVYFRPALISRAAKLGIRI